MLARFAFVAALLVSFTGCARPELPRWERVAPGEVGGCPGGYVFFDSGSARLGAQAMSILDSFIPWDSEVLDAGGWLELNGSTDHLEAERFDRGLSRRRAEAVRDYLAARGLDPRHMRVRPWGATRPLVPADRQPLPESDLAQNRYVQFRPDMPMDVFHRFFPPERRVIC